MSEMHEVWGAVLDWWRRQIPEAVQRFGTEGADELNRYQYEAEEIAELADALSLTRIAPSQRGRIERALVGSILEVLARLQCGLEDLKVQVNLTHTYDRHHPEWSRVLMRELLGRRVCVWVAPDD